MQQIPPRTAMQEWTLLATQQLGGSGHVREIDEQVKKMLQLPDEIADRLRPDGNQTVLAHRIAFARSHLKAAGLLSNPKRGVWVLTESGAAKANALGDQINDIMAAYTAGDENVPDEPGSDDATINDEGWREALLTRIQNLSPGAFERLCQRLLRESGFVQVEITGRPGDGGIDGQGLLQMARLVSFPVLFQCKRWQNPVGPGVVRDFRGAMYGRADRGLIITTSTFTADARKEAIRDGAPPIDLIDGLNLADNLRELNLGVKEIVVVNYEWFDELESWAGDTHPAGEIFGAV